MAYRARAGDTLWGIAMANHTSVQELLRLNPQLASSPNRIMPGWAVILPGATNIQPGFQPGSSPGAGSPAIRPAVPGVTVPSGSNIPANVSGISPTGTAVSAVAPAQGDLESELAGVPGAERDAYAALKTLFDSYGLDTLAPKILQYLQNGYGSDTITILLQQTPEYKARFAGNQARIKNGLQVLTPAEYLATEASYRQLLQAGGLDPVFMNQQQYAEWIGKDLSPTEIQDRVNMAVQATVNAPPELTTAFARMGIGVGDLAGYFLNDQNPPPVLQTKLAQAQIVEAGLQAGVTNPSVNQAAEFAKMGTTYQQALTGYQKIADLLPTADMLSRIYTGQQPYGQVQAEQEFLGNSGAAQLAREQLGRQEAAAFAGSGAVGQKSFAQQTAGTAF